MVVHACQYYSLNPPRPPLPLLGPQAHSPRLCLYFCPASRLACTTVLDCMYMHEYMIFFSFWLASLCVTGSRFIHTMTYYLVLFLFMVEWYSVVYMYCIFFIHSSVNGHQGFFHALAPVNSAAMTIGVHVPFWIMILSVSLTSYVEINYR